MNEKKYRVHITTPNHMFVFRGKPIRSPAIFDKITEDEMLLLKTQVHKASINATIDEIKPYTEEDLAEEQAIIDLDKDVAVEELYSFDNNEPKSTLEKLLKDEE